MYILNFKVFAHYHTYVICIPQNYVTGLLPRRKSGNFDIFGNGKPGKVMGIFLARSPNNPGNTELIVKKSCDITTTTKKNHLCSY